VTERRVYDVNAFSADDLAGLSDEEFRAVVEADLRRRAPHGGQSLRGDLVAALRSAPLVARWQSTLARMQKSVDGQLGAREGDFRAERARLEATGLLLTQNRRDGDSGEFLSDEEVERRLASLRVRQVTLRAEYERTRASTLRFKTGLDDIALEARYLRERVLEGTFEGAVVAERDRLALRCRRLSAAIAEHRDAVHGRREPLDCVAVPD
jgi:hypothetical protein